MSLKEWMNKKPDDVLDLGWDIGGSIPLGDDLDAYGTSEGVKKEWDERGRGQHEKPHFQKFFPTKQMSAAAELPKIEGFDDVIAQEIREYLIKFPRKLLHFTERVVATPELSAMHGRYVPETKTVEINPKNFSNKLKFGTHNTADIDEHVLAHELCHGLFENLTEEEQKRWMALSGWEKGWQRGQARPYVEVRPGWQAMVSSWTHAKDAKFARRYQEKNPNEDFADNAAYICTGNGLDVPEEKRNFIEALL